MLHLRVISSTFVSPQDSFVDFINGRHPPTPFLNVLSGKASELTVKGYLNLKMDKRIGAKIIENDPNSVDLKPLR